MNKEKNIISKLASSLGRRDEVPNQKLARKLVAEDDKHAIKVLIDNLGHKNKNIQQDCIKVLYEIGELKPGLISEYVHTFISLLSHKNNRLQWGAMIALNTIVLKVPKVIFDHITQILLAADKGSVITKDNAVKLLINLCSIKEYSEDAFFLLNEQLIQSPSNQFPMYAELVLTVVDGNTSSILIKTLESRLPMIKKESQKRRVEKILRKLTS